MPDDIEHVGDLIPDSQNAQLHNPRNVGLIVDASHEVGAARSIVIDEDGNILAGNATVEAAAEAGIERVQVVDADGETLIAVRRTDLTAEQKRRLAYYDNRTAELATWDVSQILADLETGVSLEGLFREDEPVGLLGDLWETEPPEDLGSQLGRAEELQEKWQVETGDLWIIPSKVGDGEHRLVCGDSTDAATVEKVMGNEEADAIATDPPYGVEYVGKTKDKLTLPGDSSDDLLALLTDALGVAFSVSRPGACRYVAAPPGPQFYVFATVLKALGVWRQTLMWVKNTMVLGHSDYHYKHEVLFYGWKPGGNHRVSPDRTQTTVWNFDKPFASRKHPAMKPVGLFERAIQNSTLKGETVYDPFLGSGTTLVACEQLGRRGRGVEIHPPYVSVCLQRLADMGLEPRRIQSSI